MQSRWLRVRAELVAGRGTSLVPAPGRVLAVPPRSTLTDLGLAIDVAFGRYDVTQDRHFATEERDLPLDVSVHLLLAPGTKCTYEYGSADADGWRHDIVVEDQLDPATLWTRPSVPIPVDGWGVLPDQFLRLHDTRPQDEPGRREDPAPLAPVLRLRGSGQDSQHATRQGTADDSDAGTQPVLDEASHSRREGKPEPLDMQGIRAARATGDVDALLDLTIGRDLGTVLQQVGAALLDAHRRGDDHIRERVARRLRDIEQLLRARDWEGDDLLADDIDTTLRGTERRGRTLSISLDDLAEIMEYESEDPGGYFHLDTGEVEPAFLRHDPEYREAAEIDEDDESDDLWVYVDHRDEAWPDMEAFAVAARPEHTGILQVAIQGKGAFRRFRQTIGDLDLVEEWLAFRDDRRHGRARALLKEHGVRPI